jgi:Tol biopolymer transport system component
MIPNLTKGPAATVEKEKEQPDEAKPVTEKKGTVSCPNCGIFFDPTLSTSILPINPPKEIQDILLDNLLAARAAAKSNKKRKAPPISAVNDESEFKVPAKITKSNTSTKPRVVATTTNSTTTGSRTVAQKLADQESKRLKAQEGMSDAVKAMFKAKDGDQRGTGGAADFFGRTYTRVSQRVLSVWLRLMI